MCQYIQISKEQKISEEKRLGETSLQSEIVDWRTYKNENYKYKIKYPEDWKVIEESPELISISDKELEKALIIIGVESEKFSSLEEYIKKLRKDFEGEEQLSILEEKVVINGREASRIMFISLKDKSIAVIAVVLIKKGNIFCITQLLPDNLKTFDRVVSTFEVLE